MKSHLFVQIINILSGTVGVPVKRTSAQVTQYAYILSRAQDAQDLVVFGCEGTFRIAYNSPPARILDY
jgi:hypothetical protein